AADSGRPIHVVLLEAVSKSCGSGQAPPREEHCCIRSPDSRLGGKGVCAPQGLSDAGCHSHEREEEEAIEAGEQGM
ncbi:hypothetical protein LTR60_003419, partial [Cryomyces antarcticus]